MRFLKLSFLTTLLALSCTSSFAETNSSKTKVVPQQVTTKVVQTEKIKVKQVNPDSVNINTASVEELSRKLKGVGLKKAQAIIEYREKNGKFLTADALTNVKGIGKGTLRKNIDIIIVK
ncbi:MAG: transporter [Pasteurellales bacterium]|nr:MAG: transporter [Pasteurellales bacterium]